MMVTTHVLAGMVLAGVTVLVAPEYLPVAVGAAALGGGFPDLDLYTGHRRTLHYPVYYSVGGLLALVVAVLATTPLTVGLAAFLLAAALHSVMDAFGGGLELKPWQGTSERAVYDHFNRRWIQPRRWVRYDGAPEDVLLATTLAVPGLVVYSGTTRTVVLGLVGVSVTYALVRKPIVTVAERLVRALPTAVVDRLPDRFTADLTL